MIPILPIVSVMTSIFKLESWATDARRADSDEEQQAASNDYEIVLGRAQIASWLFVAVIAVAVAASLAYLAGKSVATTNVVLLAPAIPAPPPPLPATLPSASIVTPSVKGPVQSTLPLFAEPAVGKVYLQVAAVDRGMATLLVEGLRNHGFASFIAPGPNENLFRVLVGPLPNPQSFRQAMAAVSAMDLALFARKYEKQGD